MDMPRVPWQAGDWLCQKARGDSMQIAQTSGNISDKVNKLIRQTVLEQSLT